MANDMDATKARLRDSLPIQPKHDKPWQADIRALLAENERLEYVSLPSMEGGVMTKPELECLAVGLDKAVKSAHEEIERWKKRLDDALLDLATANELWDKLWSALEASDRLEWARMVLGPAALPEAKSRRLTGMRR